MSNSVFNESTNTWWVNETMRFTNIHRRSACKGRRCIVHNPSDTVANREDWPYVFRDGHAGGRIERMSPSGIMHPDLDQVTYLEEVTGETHWGAHECDGSCTGSEVKKVIKKGHESWADLKGKTITFEWSDGWDDYSPIMDFSHTSPYAEDPRYPRYYVLDEDGGGYSFWETDEVEVTILEDDN